MPQNKQYSVIELPLVTEPWQKDNLDKKMECARKIYNSMLSMELKRYREMIKTREWKALSSTIIDELKSSPTKKTEKLKAAYARKSDILRENGFTEFEFRGQAINFSKYYQKHISSTMASVGIGNPMWAAFEKLLYGNGNKVSFKKCDDPITLVSDNRSGIRFLQDNDGRYYVLCSNRNAKAKPVKLYVKGPNTTYDRKMLDSNIKLVRIIKKIEKGHRKYYCQLTVDKSPYIKLDSEGNPKHPVGKGDVGIAIWREMLCAVSSQKILYINMAPDVELFSAERDLLSKELEHLRRVNNPENYNEDGTVKKGIIGEDGKRHRLYWKESNHYRKVKAELKELYRKHNVDKKLLQNKIVLELLSMGDTFHFADTSFLTMKPEWDEENPLSNSEYKIKKQRRKSIQEYAPAMLLTKLDMKLSGLGLNPINRYTIPEKLYWFRHDSGLSDKRIFTGENITIGKTIINQTMYRAFLIRHFDEIGGCYNQKALMDEWEYFINLMGA